MLISCGADGEESYPEFTYADGKITSEDGASYIPAPMGFQPANVGKKCGVRDTYFDLFTVVCDDGTVLSSDEWMTEEYAGNATSVYYRDTITLPPYDEIDYDLCTFCDEGDRPVALAEIDDRNFIASLIDAVSHGSQSNGRLDDAVASYTVKFSSSDFPGIVYSIDYLIYDDAAYLYSIGEKKYAEATGIFAPYVDLGTDAQ